MEDHPTANATATAGNTTTTVVNAQLETSKSERHVWLMKCPPIISRSLQSPPPNSSSSEFSGAVAKVIVTVDPLLPNNNFSSTQKKEIQITVVDDLGYDFGYSFLVDTCNIVAFGSNKYRLLFLE